MRSIRSTLSRALPIAALACLGCTAALAGNGNPVTVYKWVDAHGVVHYSDHPHPDAKKLRIAGAQTYSAPPMPVASPSSDEQAAPKPRGYRSCAIVKPHDQQMLMNAYKATAVVHTDPPLRPGNRVRLFYDGRQLRGHGTSFTFPVHRGQHTVSAVVVDSFGQIVCETPSVTFYVHQPSVLNPHSPLYHHPSARH